MYYRLLVKGPQAKSNNSLLIKLIERGRIIDSNMRSININPYLLKFFKKRFNRPVV